MEWRIIVPVLCLIGILHVPGNAAQANSTNTNATVYRFSLNFSINTTFLSDYSNTTSNATKDLIKNITSQVEPLYTSKYSNFLRFNISKFSNGSVVTEGELQFANGSKPNVSDLAQVLNNGSFSFALIANSTKTAEVTEAAAPANVSKISLVFKILQTFKTNYSNLTDPETIELSNNITTACSLVYKSRFPQFYRMLIKSFSNGSIVTDSVLEFNTTNSTSPNGTDVSNTLIAAIANGNFSLKIDNTSISAAVNPENATTPTTAPTTTAPAPANVSKISLVFKILQTFKTNYSNLTDPETIALSNNITTACSLVYKSRFPQFYRMLIKSFSNGSIVTDSVLEFNTTNSTSPNVTEVTTTLIAAIANGNFSFKIDNTSISAAVNPENATTPTTAPTTTPTTTAPAPAKVSKFSLVFKILQTFKTNYTNLTDPETIALSNNITTACSLVYKSRFPQFYRMLIKSFRNGSIVTDSVLEFNTTNSTSPTVTEVTNTLIAAIANGNFSFKIDNTSISAAVIPEIDSSLKDYNITFRMNETFTSDLSNMSSDGATKLAKNVTTQLDGLYKNFKDFNRTLVWRFRNGSIIVDGLLGFNKSSNSLPTVSVLARTLAEAVRNGTVKLSIDPKSINVTDPETGATANRSPVLASMLTAVWMILASLLLSAVMH